MTQDVKKLFLFLSFYSPKTNPPPMATDVFIIWDCDDGDDPLLTTGFVNGDGVWFYSPADKAIPMANETVKYWASIPQITMGGTVQ